MFQFSYLHIHSGPHERQNFSHPHGVWIYKDWAYVTDLGTDRIYQYRIDPVEGQIQRVHTTVSRRGAGPRHLVFHKELKLAFVVNELERSFVVMSIASDGRLLYEVLFSD